jgi:hypothetical protein
MHEIFVQRILARTTRSDKGSNERRYIAFERDTLRLKQTRDKERVVVELNCTHAARSIACRYFERSRFE